MEHQMNWIAAKCPSCQTMQDLPAWGVLLEAGVDDGGIDTDATATWICDTCQQLVDLPIDLTVLLKLLATGAPMIVEESDDEPDEGTESLPEAAIAGPALEFDDLIDFHESIQQDDVLAELLGDTDLCLDC